MLLKSAMMGMGLMRVSVEQFPFGMYHAGMQGCTMRFGSTAKVLAECKLKYYRISEWDAGGRQPVGIP